MYIYTYIYTYTSVYGNSTTNEHNITTPIVVR